MPARPEDASAWLDEVARDRLTLPLVVAPMFEVSTPALASAACRAGAIGALPAHNAQSTTEFDEWLAGLAEAGVLGSAFAPLAINLLVHRTNGRLEADLACVVEHGVELVIASVGSPGPVVEALHASGTRVFADVASMRHVDRALAAGVDGLILLSAGAGGQTGWANPLAFVRAARERFDGPLVLAGGIGDGSALWGAIAAGCDLGYMGTRFIAALESNADEAYRSMLIRSGLDDITTTTQLTGIPANVLSASLPSEAGEMVAVGSGFAQGNLEGNRGVAKGAGHTVHAVRGTAPCAEVIEQLRAEFAAAQRRASGHAAALSGEHG